MYTHVHNLKTTSVKYIETGNTPNNLNNTNMKLVFFIQTLI